MVYEDKKSTFFSLSTLCAYIMQVTLNFSSFVELTSSKEVIVGLSLLMTMMLLLFGAAFSENDYYLSIIGTFFVVFNLIQLTTL